MNSPDENDQNSRNNGTIFDVSTLHGWRLILWLDIRLDVKVGKACFENTVQTYNIQIVCFHNLVYNWKIGNLLL